MDVSEKPPADKSQTRQPNGYSAISSRPLVEPIETLRNTEFPPLQWLVPDYFPEGLTLFAGKPKIGKSWNSLAAALAMGRNGIHLDKRCEQRKVLYCALEDTRRRMKTRTSVILGPEEPWPADVYCTYSLPRLDNGCIEYLDRLREEYAFKVLIIDTLAAVRGRKLPGETDYQADYNAMASLRKWSQKTESWIIVVHHVRKAISSDIFDTISGTMGLTGAADTLVVLDRIDGGGLRLACRGRDIDEQDKIVEFDPLTGIWNVGADYEPGDSQEYGDTKRRIRDLLETAPMTMTPAQVAAELNLPGPAVRKALERMRRAGEIIRTAYGSYGRAEV